MWCFNVPWVFFLNWSQLPSAAVADEKVFKCWWALAGKEPLILCEPECALEASQKENIWWKQEKISIQSDHPLQNRLSTAPFLLFILVCKLQLNKFYTDPQTFWFFFHVWSRVSGMIKTLHVYRERLRETGAGLSAQNGCPALAVAPGDMHGMVNMWVQNVCLGMSTYCTCEGGDVAPSFVLTKSLVPHAKPSHTHSLDTLLLKADFIKLLV